MGAVSASAQTLLSRPLIGNGANATTPGGNGGDGGWLFGSGGNGAPGAAGQSGGNGGSAGLWGNGGAGGAGGSAARARRTRCVALVVSKDHAMTAHYWATTRPPALPARTPHPWT